MFIVFIKQSLISIPTDRGLAQTKTIFYYLLLYVSVEPRLRRTSGCLLYTSDAADE